MAGERPPRDIKSLDGLLRFCLQNTAAEDTTTASTAAEMDVERRKWLEEAIDHFTNDGETDLIKRCLEILARPAETFPLDEDDLMTRENALDQLETVVDIIDNANDCYKLGGFPILMKYIDSPYTSLQWRANSVLGVCLQNNTYCQDQALKLNLLPKLLELVDSDTSDNQVNIKSLYAVGCMIRGHAEAETSFVKHNGFSHLLRALHKNISKLNVKTIFLLSCLIQEKKEYLELLYNMGMVEQLIMLIQTPHDPYHEHVLNILVKFVSDFPPALKDCRREKYDLRQTLNQRKQYLLDKDPEAYQEELQLCEKLLKLCFSSILSDDLENMER